MKQKICHGKKFCKLTKNFKILLILQRLMHEIKNLIVQGFLKNLKSGPIVIYYSLYNISYILN